MQKDCTELILSSWLNNVQNRRKVALVDNQLEHEFIPTQRDKNPSKEKIQGVCYKCDKNNDKVRGKLLYFSKISLKFASEEMKYDK